MVTITVAYILLELLVKQLVYSGQSFIYLYLLRQQYLTININQIELQDEECPQINLGTLYV